MKRLIILATILLIFAAPATAQVAQKSLFSKKAKVTDTVPGAKRLVEVLNKVQKSYVTTPNTDSLSEIAVRSMLHSLDPHSVYIAARDVTRANESLQGNFEGVGIAFSLLHDTVVVAEVIAGGPSEKVGVAVGDKIIRIDGVNATGDSANNAFVARHLRGKKGTVAVVDILRGRDTLNFHITRDKIPIHSIDLSFMEDDSIGYIALLRFARTSHAEFKKAVADLQKQGMKSLILDLRGNSGGFLDIAYALSNEFIDAGKLIVYQEGRTVKRQDYRASRRGSFRKGRLVILIDENTASASEIVSGAVQDWDRGTIIGRRSYGKGLVQTLFTLQDGAQIRLTTARYYTPSGRCIQKPYTDYDNELRNRYKHGEMFSSDSIHFPDSLKFHTAAGRTVYGGGGIMPDIFIPLDTTPSSKFYQECRRKGLLSKFAVEWADAHRSDTTISTFDTYLNNYDTLGIDSAFVAYAAAKGIVRDSFPQLQDTNVIRFNNNFTHLQLQALIADRLFGKGHYYRIMKSQDAFYQAAVATLRKSDL